MAYYSGTTLAFSHKGGFWKTRYSFAPTCYASIDNVMISTNNTFPLASPSGKLFWEHNSSASRNTFYGKSYPSEITVVSNQDPSAIKIFKSLSIESNSNKWTGVISTNLNPSGAPQTDKQTGKIKGFSTKEGNQYSELPRSTTNSSSNIDFVCRISNTPYNLGVIDGPPVITWDVDIKTEPHVAVLGGTKTVALFMVNSTLMYLSLSSESPTDFQLTPFTTYEAAAVNNPVHVYKYSSNEGVVTFGLLTQNEDPFNFPGLISTFNIVSDLYIATSPEINGDPMRGNYLHLTLTNNSTTPVETYAVNVDFENTKLDGSKGAANRAAPAQRASRGSK